MLNIKYIYKLNIKATDIIYKIVVIIKRIRNYKNDILAVNLYYQALRELREIKEAKIASETASIIESSKGLLILDYI